MSQFVTPEERSAEVDRIRGGMIGVEFFIMHRRSVAPERKAAVMLEHLQWIVDLEKRGDIVLTGGIFRRDGSQSEGLTIFRAESWEVAERLAESDPFIQSGAASFYIERIRLGGGRLTLTVDFSDSSYRLG